MSFDALPITPARFAEAIKDLSLTTLHLKVLELRNSIAHLDYSNEQLRPFAEGTAEGAASSPPGEPDPDCADAIRENEAVVARMQERIGLVRAEVEARGLGWTEFQSKEEADAEAAAAAAAAASAAAATVADGALVNGHSGVEADSVPSLSAAAAAASAADGADGEEDERHSAWADGTFQTGTIRNGEVHLDGPMGQQGRTRGGGGSLTDEELRRRLEQRMRELGMDNDDDEGGMHL